MIERPPVLTALTRSLAEPGAGASVVGARAASWGRPAAVLVLFWWDAGVPLTEGLDGLRLVLIEKSADLRSHAGQVAFPGGGAEPDDLSPVVTALREANEEVGVRAEEVDVLGVLPEALVAVTGYRVTSVVGWWRTPRPLTAVDTVEVAAVHSVAVDDLVAPRNRWTWRLSPEHSGPAFRVRDLFVWGLTGDLLSGLLNVAGWEEPWDRRREAAVPQRFFRHPGRS